MKSSAYLALFGIAASFAWVTPAQPANEHAGHGASHAAAAQPLAEGVVKRVDKTAHRVTVAHGPLPNGMPAMTMTFVLATSVSVEQFKEGQKIRFAIEDAEGVTKIVRVEPAK